MTVVKHPDPWTQGIRRTLRSPHPLQTPMVAQIVVVPHYPSFVHLSQSKALTPSMESIAPSGWFLWLRVSQLTVCVSLCLNPSGSDLQTPVATVCISMGLRSPSHPMQRCAQSVNNSPLHLLAVNKAGWAISVSNCKTSAPALECFLASFSQPLLISQLPF